MELLLADGGISSLRVLAWYYALLAGVGAAALACLVAAPFALRGPRRGPIGEVAVVLAVASGPAAAAALGGVWVASALEWWEWPAAPLLVRPPVAAALAAASAVVLAVTLLRRRLRSAHGQPFAARTTS